MSALSRWKGKPSISRGTVAKYGTHLHCVVCKEGTYSNSYGKEQCTPCSLCSVGRTVTRNCSATKNTQCGPCSYGYYMNKVVLSCLPCSICCLDGKDQFERQCKAQGLPQHRQCKPRHNNGCQSSTTKSATSSRVIAITSNPAATPRTRTRHTRRSTLSIPSTRQENFISTVNPQDEKASSLPLSTAASLLRKGTTTAVSQADQNILVYGKVRKSLCVRWWRQQDEGHHRCKFYHGYIDPPCCYFQEEQNCTLPEMSQVTSHLQA